MPRKRHTAEEIVKDDDVAGLEGRNQRLLNPCSKDHSVDRAIKHQRRDDAIASQSRQEGHGVPMTIGSLGHQLMTPSAPAAKTGHIGLDPCLINEDQPCGIKAVLVPAPTRPKPGDP